MQNFGYHLPESKVLKGYFSIHSSTMQRSKGMAFSVLIFYTQNFSLEVTGTEDSSMINIFKFSNTYRIFGEKEKKIIKINIIVIFRKIYLLPTSKICASPSCINTTAKSALAEGSITSQECVIIMK